MGFIPETIFKPLASSVVGTLGIDRTKGQTARTLAEVANSLAPLVIQRAAKKKQTLDILNSEAQVRQFEAAIDNNTTEAKNNFRSDPKIGVQQMFDNNETLLNKTVGEIKDENIRALFASKASTVIRRKNAEMRAWAEVQGVVNASSDFVSVTDMNAAQLKLDPNIDKFWEYTAVHESRKSLAKQLYGKNWGDAMRKGHQSQAKGLLAGLEDKDPRLGLKLIRSGNLNKFFDGEEIAELEENMLSSIKGWDEKVKLEKQIKLLDTLNIADEELTIAKVDEIEISLYEQEMLTPDAKEVVADLRKIAAEKTDITAIEHTPTLAKLHDEYRNLQVDRDKLDSKATLTEIYKFISHVISASAKGQISPTQRNTFLINVETIKTKGLLEAGEKGFAEKMDDAMAASGIVPYPNVFTLFSSPDTPEQYGYRKVYDWLEEMNFSDDVEAKAKVKILNDTMTEITELREKGINITNGLVDIMIERHFRAEFVRQNPKLQNIPEEGIAIRLRNGDKVLLFSNGSYTPLK